MPPTVAHVEDAGHCVRPHATDTDAQAGGGEGSGASVTHLGQPTVEITLDDPSDTAPVTEEVDFPSGVKFWSALFIITAALVLASLDINIVATAVPRITDHFHSVADVGWYLSAYRLCACSFQFIFGKAYKFFSIKFVFLLANVISLAGSLLCGTAATSSMLVVGRALSGLGGAGLLSGCFTILVHTMPLRRRPIFVGILGGIESLAIVAAPLLGGVLTQSLGWRWCFYINLPTGAVTLLLTIFFYSDARRPNQTSSLSLKQKISQLDPVSNLLFIPALTSLFIALSWAGTKYSWKDGEVVGLLVTFAALLAAFSYNQYRRGDSAALPPRIVKKRSVIAGFIFITCLNSAKNVLDYYLPIYYQTVRGYNPARSGYMMLPSIIGTAIGTIIHGAGTSAFGYYAPFMLLSSVMMPIAAGLITTFKINTDLVQLIVYTALAGLANGLGFSGPQTAVQTVLPTEDAPLGLSIMLFAQSFGPALTISIAQVLLTNQLSTNLIGLVPDLDRVNIENHGLSGLVRSVPTAKSGAVLSGIDKSLSHTWYLVVGLACAMIIGSSSIEWRSVKKKRD